jgi:hypothetical protein
MKPFTLSYFTEAQKAQKPGGLIGPRPFAPATAMFKLLPAPGTHGSAGEAAYSRERDMGQRRSFGRGDKAARGTIVEPQREP